MDRFGVPKTVNRHVLRALETIYCRKGSRHEEHATFTEILSEVKHTMRNVRPVRNLSGCVRRSLRNLEKEVGFIRSKTPKTYTLGPSSSKPLRTMFPNAVSTTKFFFFERK